MYLIYEYVKIFAYNVSYSQQNNITSGPKANQNSCSEKLPPEYTVFVFNIPFPPIIPIYCCVFLLENSHTAHMVKHRYRHNQNLK